MTALEEPTTAVTDWILAALTFYWGAMLIASAADPERGLATIAWAAGFLATAGAATVGGVVHGFQGRMGPARTLPLWRAVLHLITLASAGMLAAVLLVLTPSPLRAAGLALVLLKLVAVNLLIAQRSTFAVALGDHAVSLAAVLALQIGSWWVHDARSGPWIAGGVAIAAVAGAIQAFRVAPHPRFNHNDLYHVVQIVALWVLYRGGLLLEIG